MTKQPDIQTYEAAQSFTTVIHGRTYSVSVGDRASAGHELVKTHPALFRPMTVQYPDDETAVVGVRTAKPARKRRQRTNPVEPEVKSTTDVAATTTTAAHQAPAFGYTSANDAPASEAVAGDEAAKRGTWTEV